VVEGMRGNIEIVRFVTCCSAIVSGLGDSRKRTMMDNESCTENYAEQRVIRENTSNNNANKNVISTPT
jgi:hypothetical protein